MLLSPKFNETPIETAADREDDKMNLQNIYLQKELNIYYYSLVMYNNIYRKKLFSYNICVQIMLKFI